MPRDRNWPNDRPPTLQEQHLCHPAWGNGKRNNRRYATSAMLRTQADQLEAKRRKRGTATHPPQLTEDDAAEVARLEARLAQLKARRLEREIAELQDVLASPTALRTIAEWVAEEEERIRRVKEELWEHWTREQARRRNVSRHREPLDVFNLPSNATSEQIKQRYRELVKQLHPDTNAGSEGARGLLLQLTEAMDQLRAEGRV